MLRCQTPRSKYPPDYLQSSAKMQPINSRKVIRLRDISESVHGCQKEAMCPLNLRGLTGSRTKICPPFYSELIFRALAAHPSAKTKHLWPIIQDDWESDEPQYDQDCIISIMDVACIE